MDYSFGEFDDM